MSCQAEESEPSSVHYSKRPQCPKKPPFHKSASAEPNAPVFPGVRRPHRRTSFTSFWNNLFKTKTSENRLSGISTQSSSFESVNTILSSNSFSFVSPKKYKGKQKGKRIPMPVEEPQKPRRKISTLTRLGIKIGLKSKYNLQSCESLHNLTYLESGASSNAGTLSSTYRRKRRAPPPPNGTLPRDSTLNRSRPNSPLSRNYPPDNIPSSSKILSSPTPSCSNSIPHTLASQETLPPTTPEISKQHPEISKQHPEISKQHPEISKQQPGTLNLQPNASNPQPGTSSQQPEALQQLPEILRQQPDTLKNQPDTQNLPGTSKSVETFKITARHKRASSEGTFVNTFQSTSKHCNSLSHTNRTKSHVRGKRKAPVPPNPFGDPDVPEEEPTPRVDPFNRNSAARAVNPTDNKQTSERNSSSSSLNAIITLQPEPPERPSASASFVLPPTPEDEEIAQNIRNDEEEKKSQRENRTDHLRTPIGTYGVTSQRETVVITTTSKQSNDEAVRNQAAKSKRESDKSPLMFLRTSSTNIGASTSSNSVSPGSSIRNTYSNGFDSDAEMRGGEKSPSASPVPPFDESFYLSSTSGSSQLHPATSAPSTNRLAIRPWFKRSSPSNQNGKKTKQLIKPVSNMTKFSDIDREASRIVEESRRRSAEQAYNDNARELITMFNAFSKSQLAGASESNDKHETDNAANAASESMNDQLLETTAQPQTSSAERKNPASPVSNNAGSGGSSAVAASVVSDPGTSVPCNESGATKRPESTSNTNATSTSSSSTAQLSRVIPQVKPVDEPKKLAIVQPQSSSGINSAKSSHKSNESGASGNVSSSAASKDSKGVGIASSTFLNSRREDWNCPRCTLRNSHWRLTCDACSFRVDSSIQKITSIFENEIRTKEATQTSGVKPNDTSTKNGYTRRDAASSTSGVEKLSKAREEPNIPLCENFLSQLPPKETLTRVGKLVGMFHHDNAEELDIVKLRQARLAFFEKHSAVSEIDSLLSGTNTNVVYEQNELTTNNLAGDSNDSNQGNDIRKKLEKKVLNVFSDDEDDSIDALLEIPRRQPPYKVRDNSSELKDMTNNTPMFLGPTNMNWSPFHHQKFRPMLESIIEASSDTYLRLDPIYENWDMNACDNNALNCNISPTPTAATMGENRTWTNTFMPMHAYLRNSPNENNNGYNGNSNSDSSSCSEYESQNSGTDMDGKNRGPSRRHSSHHHNYFHANQQRVENRMEERKLTREDYQKLGAIPKNFEGYYRNETPPDTGNNVPGSSGKHTNPNDPRRHSSYTSPDEMGISENSYENSQNPNNTIAVNKLLAKLEYAISRGEHRLAAALAHDLALLRVNCVVAKGEQKAPKPIKIRVYVEDRFMQQGPFQVQVTQNMTVKDLKNKIETDWNIPSAFQKWILGRKIAEDENLTLAEFDVEHDTMTFLYLVTPQIEKKSQNNIPEPSSAVESIKKPPVPGSSNLRKPPENNINDTPPRRTTGVNTETEKNIGSEKIVSPVLPPPAVKVANTPTRQNIQESKVVVASKETPAKSTTAQPIQLRETKTVPSVNTSASPRSQMDNESQKPKAVKSLTSKGVPTDTTVISKNITTEVIKPSTIKPLESLRADLQMPASNQKLPQKKQDRKQELKMSKDPPQVLSKQIPSTSTVPNIKPVIEVSRNVKEVKSPFPVTKVETNIKASESSKTHLVTKPVKNPKSETSIGPIIAKSANTTGPLLVKAETTAGPLITKPENITGTLITKPENTTGPLIAKPETTTGLVKPETNPGLVKPETTTGQLTAKTESNDLNLNDDVPNWNPEPVPKRRTKHLKKSNNETTTPPSENVVTGQLDPAKITSSSTGVDAKVPGSSSASIIKPVASQNKVEPVYSNASTPVSSKSPAQAPISLTIGAPRSENIPLNPPPLPEKKTVKKESIAVTGSVSPPLPEKAPDAPLPVEFSTSPEPNIKLEEIKVSNIVEAVIDDKIEASPVLESKIAIAATDIASPPAAEALSAKASNIKEDNRETYAKMLQLMEQADLINNSEELECPICFNTIQPSEGVVLRDCLHSFCKECLIGSVQYADEPEVKCPFRDDKYSCQSVMQEREIKALVPPEIFERYLANSVKVAECKIVNTFHCKTADCTGWCVFEDDVNVFNCPVCKKRNCLTCQAIHEGVDCQQYQRQLAIDSETDENAKSSRLMLEKMIQRGEALECPACHVVLLKKWGCDWVRCSYCKTEICWITKGFRWGPNGKGDTSGGCKCGVNGVRCHPKCTYCH